MYAANGKRKLKPTGRKITSYCCPLCESTKNRFFWAFKLKYLVINPSINYQKLPFCWMQMRIKWLNSLKPNDHYSGRTASLTSKRCILYIYSTIIGTKYFKQGFSLQNAVCFIILTYLVRVLFTFYIQSVLKFKKK